MKLIAHRGNYKGKTDRENTVELIEEAITEGYDVEVDVRLIGSCVFLGHDAPDYLVDVSFLEKHKNKLWMHAKNHEALEYFLWLGFNVFFHDQDEYTLTSKGIVWAYSGCKVGPQTVAVMPELTDFNPEGAYGVCSDDLRGFE